jgi:TolB protein
MIDEKDLREMLRRRADGVDARPDDPPAALRRARRRLARTGAIAVLAVTVLAVGAFAGIRSLHGSERQIPASPGPVIRNGRVVFVSLGVGSANDRLFTLGPDGTGLRPLVDFPAEYPDWSPDGSTIAFDDGNTITHADWSKDAGHIFTVLADGTGLPSLKQITDGGGAEFTPAWSPDGTRMAVTAEGESGLPAGIFILEPATGAMHPLTANPYGYQDKEPDYSTDGTRIAFVRDRQLVESGDASDMSALFVVNVDGTDLRQLTAWAQGLVGTPSWSPDGAQIVFRAGAQGPSQIFVIGADGTGLKQLTFGAPGEPSYWPSWSPDGTRIVFTRAVAGSFIQLFTMSPDGSHVAPLISTTPVEANEADWGTRP